MNERIKELAEQAGAYVNEVYTPPVRSKTPGKIWEDGHIDWHEQFHKKFAELIVRECADVLVAEMNRLDGLDRVVSAQTMDTAQILIKQHFGVEE